MKKYTRLFQLIFLSIIPVLLISATDTSEKKYTLSDDFSVTINGTSNLHNWDEKVETVTGDAAVKWNADKSFDLNKISIKMDVHSIKSHEGSAMNNNTYKALKGDANPQIIFTLDAPLKSIKDNSAESDVTTNGSLTIAGVKKTVNIKVKIMMQKNSLLAFEGSETIKMTDYNIKPPTALFGTLKTGDEITIHFKTNFKTDIEK